MKGFHACEVLGILENFDETIPILDMPLMVLYSWIKNIFQASSLEEMEWDLSGDGSIWEFFIQPDCPQIGDGIDIFFTRFQGRNILLKRKIFLRKELFY